MRVALHGELIWLSRLHLTPGIDPDMDVPEKEAAIEYERVGDLPGGQYLRAKGSLPVFRRTDTMHRVLRFEVDRDHEGEMWEWLHRNGYLSNRGLPEGPLKFMGVDVYLVPKLPAPGWRIINPMRKQ